MLTNVKDKDEANNRQGAVYKIECSDCQAYICETGRNLNARLTEHKRTTRNSDANDHIAVHFFIIIIIIIIVVVIIIVIVIVIVIVIIIITTILFFIYL